MKTAEVKINTGASPFVSVNLLPSEEPVRITEGRFTKMHAPPAITSVAMVNRHSVVSENLNGAPTVKAGDFELVAREFDVLSPRWSPFVTKVLYFAMGEFARLSKPTSQNREGWASVTFSVQDFLDLVNAGKDISFRTRQNQIEDINNALDVLYYTDIHTKTGGYRIIAGRDYVRNGYARMTFHPDFAEKLMDKAPLTFLHNNIFRISGKSCTAFALAVYMNAHYLRYPNIARGTENRLSIKNILAHSGLPTIKKIRETAQSWLRCIKLPLENALEEMKSSGVLTSWHYCHAKAKPLTLLEVQCISIYEEWEKLYIAFEIADAGNHSGRLLEVQEKRKEKAKKAAATKKGKNVPKQ